MHRELSPPELVDTDSALSRAVEIISSFDEIAVDTEADSFFSYREKVCLVQISVGERDFVIDPLAGLDLAPLGNVLADPKRTKVFHDGEYDILILKRDWRFEFRGLYDTRIAEAALGVESPGLAAVLRARFGVELDKSMQRSDWSARPLSEKQIQYARLDTRFLTALMHSQLPELRERGREMIVEGECQRLERLQPAGPVFSADDFVKIKGARTLDLAAQRRLRELYLLRHELASAADLPAFKVLGNELLFTIAERSPRSIGELERSCGISPKQSRRYGDPILRALARASELGPLERTPNPPARDGTDALDEGEVELHEQLKEWRRERGSELGVDSSLVINRHVLLKLAKSKPTSIEELERVEGILPWQVEMFGPKLVERIERAWRDMPQTLGAKRRRRGPRR